MGDWEAARLQVDLFDRRNAERQVDGQEPYGEPSHITFARAVLALTAERDRLREAVEMVLARIGQLQEQWGKEGFTDGTADQLREALKQPTTV